MEFEAAAVAAEGRVVTQHHHIAAFRPAGIVGAPSARAAVKINETWRLRREQRATVKSR